MEAYTDIPKHLELATKMGQEITMMDLIHQNECILRILTLVDENRNMNIESLQKALSQQGEARTQLKAILSENPPS